MDGFGGYKNGAATALPDAVTVMDAFYDDVLVMPDADEDAIVADVLGDRYEELAALLPLLGLELFDRRARDKALARRRRDEGARGMKISVR